MSSEELVVGLVSVSDRASAGVYKDEGIPALKEWLSGAIASPKWRDETRLIADEQDVIEKTLVELADLKGCHLILTTGGTGPAPRMPGFGEQMRAISLKFVPTAILSRQLAVIRGKALIINLPGQPKSIRETLQGLPDAPGIFAAVPYCIDLIGGPYVETNESVVKAFRPKSALRKK
jgi:molybdopterin adenylyltransferase